MTQKASIYSDGGARGNPGPAAIGYLIVDEGGITLAEHAEVIGRGTNNVAEYTAVIKALKEAILLGLKEIDYYVDSELVQRQLTGVYRVKTPHIRDLFLKVKELEKQFAAIRFHHRPRTHERLRQADRLLNTALNAAGH